MKLEDCKLGVRVRVYDCLNGVFVGTIRETSEGDKIGVECEIPGVSGWYYPQQLRKLAPKKDKPTVGFAFNQDGSWNMPVELTYTNTIDLLKRQGCDVWVMRGTRKL